MSDRPAACAKLLRIFIQHAIEGKRCPTVFELPSGSSADARQLARDGLIRIEISGQNYRTVTILTGLCAGKSTARDPSGAAVWRVIDETDRIHGKVTRRPTRAQILREALARTGSAA